MNNHQIKLATAETCTGCTACYSICSHSAIDMRANTAGFRYPIINSTKCVVCGLCEFICPVIKPDSDNLVPLLAFVAQAKDQRILEKSASGGIFTAIAQQFIAEGGIVVGAAYDSNLNVCHITCSEQEELQLLSGSKYVQSELNDIFKTVKDYLQEGKQVLFSGTPCQVAGLKSFLRKDYSNLLCVDFLCHSIAAPTAFDLYKKHIARKYGEIRNIEFKSKRYGYFFPTLAVEIQSGRGAKWYYFSSQSDPYMYAFLNGSIARPSCSDCKFRRNHKSDLTIADYYHASYKGLTKPEAGITRIAVWTERAKAYLSNMTTLERDELVSSHFFDKNDLFNHKGNLVDFDRLSSVKEVEFFAAHFKVPLKSKLIAGARWMLAFLGLQKIVKSIIQK